MTVRWDLYEKCIRWAGALLDEDARRDVALATLEEVGDRDLTEQEISRRVKWRARNHLRRKGRPIPEEVLIDPRAEDFVSGRDANRAPSPEEQLHAAELRERMAKVIGADNVAFLEQCAEMSAAEVARRTGMTPVGARVKRARLRLKVKGLVK